MNEEFLYIFPKSSSAINNTVIADMNVAVKSLSVTGKTHINGLCQYFTCEKYYLNEI